MRWEMPGSEDILKNLKADGYFIKSCWDAQSLGYFGITGGKLRIQPPRFDGIHGRD